ncbi:hypothetical protein PRIPAC_95237, partial [Pristionchus pacificus]
TSPLADEPMNDSIADAQPISRQETRTTIKDGRTWPNSITCLHLDDKHRIVVRSSSRGSCPSPRRLPAFIKTFTNT